MGEMYIPSDLGYGDQGSPPDIKGGDVLIFQMEILKINGEKVPASKCDVKTLAGCSDKKKKYVEKQKQATPEKRAAELERLKGLATKEMKAENMQWMDTRIKLLR